MIQSKKYENIDCLRSLSCFAIIAMHIQANTSYNIEGIIWNTIIPSWTWLVYLFLIISGFGMCCGYYDKIADKTVDIEQFYIKRFKKTVPFFACLILLAVVMEHTLEGLYEGFMELTMAYGLLPNNELSILGVSWTLGVVFLFYIMFPYFVFLLRNKRRAWMVLVVSLVINQMCSQYFFTGKFVIDTFTPRHSFLFCIPFFVGGGIMYLYREQTRQFVSRHRWLVLSGCVIATVIWYVVPNKIGAVQIFTLKSLLLFSLWLIYAISVQSHIMDNRIMRYFGEISMEMYLAQMVVFRVIEKAGLLYIFGTGWISFIVACLAETGLLVIGIEAYRKLEKICGNRFAAIKMP